MPTEFTPEEFAEINKRAESLKALVKAVVAEINECNSYLKDNDTPFWRRVAYRSIFASIEALTNHLKQNSLLHTFGEESFFSDAERMALSDREYIVNEQGDVTERNAKIRTLPNILLAFKAFSRLCGKQFSCAGSEGWDALKRSIKVRDRITHPKNAADYEISDQEFNDANKAWIWFSSTLSEVTRPAKEIAEAIINKSKKAEE